mgnify:CR=1 FL=1|jgi:hypothetical protein
MASELEVGKVGVGTAPVNKLSVEGYNTSTTVGTDVDVHIEGGGSANHLTQLGFGYNAQNTSWKPPVIIGSKTGNASGQTEADFFVATRSGTTGTDAPATRLTIDSSGNVEQHTNTNGITKFVVKNEDAGAAARAGVQVIGESSNIDLWANSAAYSGVTGWADSGVVSTGSGSSGGLKMNAVAGGLALQTNQTTRVSIANSTGLATFSNGITVSGGFTTLGSFSEVTISGGGVAVTSSTHRVDTEGDASSDDLYGITGGTDGSILILQIVHTDREVTVKHSNGTTGQNIRLDGGADFALDHTTDVLTLVKHGSFWCEVSRSNN